MNKYILQAVSSQQGAGLNQNVIPESALQFEGTEDYIFFENDLTEEYITFETT